MNLKINQIHSLNNIESKGVLEKADQEFKFTQRSKIEEDELQNRLKNLMTEINKQGSTIKEHVDVKDMKRYRSLIKDFMNEVINHSHEFSRENFLDRRGRHRVYGIIRLVDQNLDDLATELMKEEKDHLEVLDKIDEIKGLLLDLLV